MNQMSVHCLRLNSGYHMPQLGLGTWQSNPENVGEAVKMAADIGYRHIDCAYAYLNQEDIGKALKDIFANGKVKREEIFITSKIWNNAHSYKGACAAIDQILEQLGLEYLDLCLIHWPMGFAEGGDLVPTDDKGNTIYSNIDYLETWKAMEDAVNMGKIRSIGLSNFNSRQIERVLKTCKIRPTVLQVEVHPYFPQDKLREYCQNNGILVTAFGSLLKGMTGFLGEEKFDILKEKVLLAIAEKHKKSAAQVVLRWAIQKGIIVIPKSINGDRLKENSEIFDFELSSDEMGSIGILDRNFRFLAWKSEEGRPDYPFEN